MKTAVSIPNDLFEGADRLARRTRKSRSRVFSDALRDYLAHHTPDNVTDAMDKAISEIDAEAETGNAPRNGAKLRNGYKKDAFHSRAARTTLQRTEW